MPELPFQSPIGLPFVELQSVDSTNNYALQQVHAGLARHGAAFFAHHQFAGKGQRGRSWSGEPGANLLLSVVVNPHPLTVSRQFELSACIAIAGHELISHYAGDNCSIKWPNDLYWQDRKAGGILVENIIRPGNGADSQWQWAVIGTGINVNQTSFPEGLPNPVSLKQVTGQSFNAVYLAHQYCEILAKKLRQLLMDGFPVIHSDYLERLYKRGETARFRKGNRGFEARVKTVRADGRLVLEHAIEEEFSFGELEWIIPQKNKGN